MKSNIAGSLVGKMGDRNDDISAWALVGACNTASNNTIRTAIALRIGGLLGVDQHSDWLWVQAERQVRGP